MTDPEVKDALNFLMSHVAVKMQGAVAELLALQMVVDMVDEGRRAGLLPPQARVIPGSRIHMRVEERPGWHKGADGLVVVEGQGVLAIHGIIEIKSNRPSRRKLTKQMRSHWTRLALGLRIDHTECPPERVVLVDGEQTRAILVTPLRDRPTRDLRMMGWFALSFGVPYDELTATGQALVVWLLEQIGIKAFAHVEDAEDEAVHALRSALRNAQSRAMGAKAVRLAAKLLKIHFGRA